MKPILAAALGLMLCGIASASEHTEAYAAIKASGTWSVTKGTEAYTLDEFVESGKFCKWRGRHEWGEPLWTSLCRTEECSICHRCRSKVKVKKTVEEWEP